MTEYFQLTLEEKRALIDSKYIKKKKRISKLQREIVAHDWFL